MGEEHSMKTDFRITRIMFIILFATGIISGCATAPQSARPAAPTQAASDTDVKKIIVAKVNSAALNMDAYIDTLNSLPDKSGPETLEERKMRALDALVLKELAYQRALSQGLVADPAQVEIAFVNFKDSLGGSEAYQEVLAKKNTTDTGIRSGIEREMTINLIHKREVMDRIIIPDEDLRKEYEKEKKYYITVEKTKVIDVFLLKDEGKVSQKKAKELLKKIKADPNKDPWKLTLDGTFIVRHLSAHKERDKAIYEAGKTMKPGGLSGVIRDSAGLLHIIKLIEYIPERPLTWDELKPILEEKMKAGREEKRTQEWEQELRTGAKIE